MGKIAFVFSGQGDQYPGMGRQLCETYPAAAEVFALCDAIRPGTSDQCFSGTEEALRQTENTQPCLFAMELAAAAVLLDRGVQPAAVAGFSLGEVVAATVSGLFRYEAGFRLVCRRGALMQAAAAQADTAMAAVVRLTGEQVQALCEPYPDVYPVNYNCPGQITVSGDRAQLEQFSADVKAAGGRAIALKVRGAFHSPFMADAADEFALALEQEELGNSTVPLYSDMTAAPYQDNVIGLLSQQICHPVRWEALIRAMIASGVTTFIEIGPGRTLTNMIGKIDKTVKAVPFSDYLAEVSPC